MANIEMGLQKFCVNCVGNDEIHMGFVDVRIKKCRCAMVAKTFANIKFDVVFSRMCVHS